MPTGYNIKDEFVSAYQEAVTCTCQNCKGTFMTCRKFLVTAINDNWLPVTLAITRLIATKPHSCDVEHLLSAYNQLKDPDQCKMSSETSDAYLTA